MQKREVPMKKSLRSILFAAAAAAGILAAGCGSLSLFSDPWEGTWWGVQDAGVNWSGDEIRNLETFTFTPDGDNIIVEHRTQRGAKEIEGPLSGTAVTDGGRLVITPKDGGRETEFSYSRTSRKIETSLTNADGSPVMLKELTEDNNSEMEKIRSDIVHIFSKPENQVNTTLSGRR